MDSKDGPGDGVLSRRYLAAKFVSMPESMTTIEKANKKQLLEAITV